MLRSGVRADARIVPVAVWPHSRVTEAVLAVANPGQGISLVFEQSKPRLDRTVADRGHRSAWDVEMPHQVLLAMYLAGPVEGIRSADVWDADVRGIRYPEMGGARLVLEHRDGGRSVLISDLCSREPVRRLRILRSDGDLVADYPVSGAHTGLVRQPDGSTRIVAGDRPLTRFIESAYRHFAHPDSAVTVTNDVHLASLALIDEAAAIARRRSQAQETSDARAVL
jgi:hypothetical protein